MVAEDVNDGLSDRVSSTREFSTFRGDSESAGSWGEQEREMEWESCGVWEESWSSHGGRRGRRAGGGGQSRRGEPWKRETEKNKFVDSRARHEQLFLPLRTPLRDN